MLKQERFSWRVNRKCLARAQHPDRDRQFKRIAALRAQPAHEGGSVISVATQKKELVGLFRSPAPPGTKPRPR